MQKMTILCTGKLKEKFYLDAVAEYVKRLSRFCKLEIIELPEERLPEDPSPAQIEADRNAIEMQRMSFARLSQTKNGPVFR